MSVRRTAPVQLTRVEAEETNAVEVRRGTGEKCNNIGQRGNGDARAAQSEGLSEPIDGRLGRFRSSVCRMDQKHIIDAHTYMA